MTRNIRDKLVKALQAIKYDGDGEPSKYVIVVVEGQSQPWPDVTGVVIGSDTIQIEAAVAQE